MNAIAFDTHLFVKRLTAAGMPEAQAEVLAEEQARLISDRLATKVDLERLRGELQKDTEHLRSDLQKDIEGIRSELKQDIEIMRVELTHDLTLRLGGMMVTGIVVVAALVKLL